MKIELPFELGVQLWKATLQHTSVREICPECNGDKVCVVKLGNGEEFMLPCKQCDGDICTPPSGYITRHQYEYIPVSFIPHRWGIYDTNPWYSESSPDVSSYQHTDAKDLFVDFMECNDRCKQLNEERNKQEREREFQHLMHKRKNYAWSVHYWRSQRNKLRKDLDWIEARLVQIKERSK